MAELNELSDAPGSPDGTAPPRAELIADADVPGAWAVMMGGTEQSWIDPADPTHLEFDYVQRIADAIDLHAPAGQRIRIIHIGGAAMTLPRYVAHTRPSSAQIVLEPDAELTARVRETIPLPRNSGIKVRPTDGRSGIAEMRDDYADVVVVDAFAGPMIPADLTSLEFYLDAARVLVGDGTIMVNITDRAPFAYARRVVAGVAEVFGEVVLSAESATIKGRRFGNLVILGSAALPVSDLVRCAAGSAFPYRLVHGRALTKWLAGARPFTDADPGISPGPPDGRTFFG